MLNAPSGPKQRDWGRPPNAPSAPGKQHSLSKSSQSYGKPPGFVKAEDANGGKDDVRGDKAVTKTDEELETERKEQRRQEEELSFKDVCRRLHQFCDVQFIFCSENGGMSLVNDLVS